MFCQYSFNRRFTWFVERVERTLHRADDLIFQISPSSVLKNVQSYFKDAATQKKLLTFQVRIEFHARLKDKIIGRIKKYSMWNFFKETLY